MESWFFWGEVKKGIVIDEKMKSLDSDFVQEWIIKNIFWSVFISRQERESKLALII